MVIKEPYESLTKTLLALKIQVIDSLPYVHEYIPDGNYTPESLFNFLKPNLKYQNDPKGIEYIQTMQTLMDANGRGDCDCFTVTALAACSYLDYKPLYVTIVGNTAMQPTHIYAELYDPYKKQICAMDFTNPIYNMQRPYKFKQRLLFKL